jgi:hypothetical protein
VVDDLFDKENLMAQRVRLVAERDRILNAIAKLDEFLAAMGVPLDPATAAGENLTLTEAIRRLCLEKKTGITKGNIIKDLATQYPRIKASDASVAAILAAMTKSNPPTLFVEIKGSGRRGAEYGIEDPPRLKLHPAEVAILMDPERTNGTGGWQSLFNKIQNNYEEDTKELLFPDSLKEQIRHYCANYGVGGYQSHLKRALGRHVPEIFR